MFYKQRIDRLIFAGYNNHPSPSFPISFPLDAAMDDLLAYASSSPRRGTFLHDQDHQGHNETAWLALLDGLRTGDVAAIAEGLHHARGTLVTRTRSGTVRQGRLPHRVEALLHGNPWFDAHQAQQEQRFGARWARSAMPEADAETENAHGPRPLTPRWVNAAQLAWWVAPEMMPAVLREQARTQTSWSCPTQRWITNDGRTVALLNDGGARGLDTWNPAWPAMVVTMASLALDHEGEQRYRDTNERAEARRTYVNDSPLRTWLRNILSEPLERIGSDGPRVDTAPDSPTSTVWTAALTDALARGDAQGWDTPAWSAWARRWILATQSLSLGSATGEVVQAFWQRCPDALLPVRRDDSVRVRTVMGQTDDPLFTDERVSAWLIHGEGGLLRTAVADGRGAWTTDEPYESMGVGDTVRWTWLEWAVWHQRVDVATRLINQGQRLIEGFDTMIAPDKLPPYSSPDHLRQWPVVREQRRGMLERLHLLETANERHPHGAPARPRNRL